MATKPLTPRQKEIKALVDKGLSAPQIAKKLSITDNGVYQQLRRMGIKAGGKKSPVAKPKASARPKAAPLPAAKAKPVEVLVMRDQTPLQAIRARRDSILSGTKEASQAVTDAQAALNAAQAVEKRLLEKHTDELKTLDKAESALTGKQIVDGKVKAKHVKAKAPAPAATPPAPPQSVPMDHPAPPAEADPFDQAGEPEAPAAE